MYRKRYKMRKRRKAINPYAIFIVFAATIIFASYAYSLLSDSIFIKGKANILQQQDDVCKSTYYWKVTASWPSENLNSTVYAIEFYIDYQDEDISSWNMEIALPEGFVPTGNNFAHQAEEFSTYANKIILTSKDWSGYISNNSTFTLYTQLDFAGDPGFLTTTTPEKMFKSFKINNKIVKYKDPNSTNPDENTTNNTTDSNVTNNTTNNTTDNNTTENNTTNNTGNEVNNTTNNTTGGNTTIDPPIADDGLSTYTWEKNTPWGGDNGTPYVYPSTINIVNLDADYYDSIEISFEVPDGFLLEASGKCNIWQADTVTQNGNVVTIKFKDNAVYLTKGQTLTIYPHLYFENEVDFYIKNLVFNGKKAILKN